MINFSKIHNLLTNTGTKKGHPSFGLNCVVHELFMNPVHTVQYIYFETSNKVPCLLYVDSENFKIHKDIPIKRKETELTVWSGYEPSVGYVLNTSVNDDKDFDVLPEMSMSVSPEPYIELITMLSSTIKAVSYKLAVMVEDFLLVDDGEMINIFNIPVCENPKLLIVVDLLTLLDDLSVKKIEKVSDAMSAIMVDTCNKYWTCLHSLLLKCKELKIITKGKQSIDSTKCLTNMVKLQTSNCALKLALETLKLK